MKLRGMGRSLDGAKEHRMAYRQSRGAKEVHYMEQMSIGRPEDGVLDHRVAISQLCGAFDGH